MAVERKEARQDVSRQRIDKKRIGEVPAFVAKGELLEVVEAVRDLEADSVEGEGAVGAAQRSDLLGGEGLAECLQAWTGTGDSRRVEKTVERCHAGLGVDLAVVLHLDERLGDEIQLGEGDVGLLLQKGEETPLDLAPEDFLLAVLVRTVGQCGLVDDGQPAQALAVLPREHGRAIVRQKDARETALEKGLQKAVNEFLRALALVPLGVADQPRMVIEDPQQKRLDPLAPSRQDPARRVVEVQMPHPADILDLEAALLPGRRGPFSGRQRTRSVLLRQTLAQKEAPDARVRRRRSMLRVLLCEGDHVVEVKLVTPGRVIRVLSKKECLHAGRQRPIGSFVRTALATQGRNRPRTLAGFVVPALDRRDAEPHGTSAPRMPPRLV